MSNSRAQEIAGNDMMSFASPVRVTGPLIPALPNIIQFECNNPFDTIEFELNSDLDPFEKCLQTAMDKTPDIEENPKKITSSTEEISHENKENNIDRQSQHFRDRIQALQKQHEEIKLQLKIIEDQYRDENLNTFHEQEPLLDFSEIKEQANAIVSHLEDVSLLENETAPWPLDSTYELIELDNSPVQPVRHDDQSEKLNYYKSVLKRLNKSQENILDECEVKSPLRERSANTIVPNPKVKIQPIIVDDKAKENIIVKKPIGKGPLKAFAPIQNMTKKPLDEKLPNSRQNIALVSNALKTPMVLPGSSTPVPGGSSTSVKTIRGRDILKSKPLRRSSSAPRSSLANQKMIVSSTPKTATPRLSELPKNNRLKRSNSFTSPNGRWK